MDEVVVKNTIIYNQSSQNCINFVKKHQLVVVICYEWWLNWQEWWLQKATTDQCGHIPGLSYYDQVAELQGKGK